ncbi:hypothetical protein KC19_12G179200 [Ceratodon purpureus]|uniref:Uncharacterized protein n=1 Tax=Ceratodon purpureus TaxID=3225 RepID=A0A8T0GAT3_CERPU|nr:hypothetical protein KC19_12G179200 [Ceratodon purpureus]
MPGRMRVDDQIPAGLTGGVALAWRRGRRSARTTSRKADRQKGILAASGAVPGLYWSESIGIPAPNIPRSCYVRSQVPSFPTFQQSAPEDVWQGAFSCNLELVGIDLFSLTLIRKIKIISL